MNESTAPSSKSTNVFLWVSGIVSALIYVAITWLSYGCEQTDIQQERPLLTLLVLFTAAGIVYLAACFVLIVRGRNQTTGISGLPIMIGCAIAFRLILMFSIPIQEVDLYRYIWDGVVTAQGISPYKYSPEEVDRRRVALREGTDARFQYRTKVVEQRRVSSLAKLAAGEDLKKVFHLVHFKQYTTPYPPTNQPFFALAAVLGQATGHFYGYLFSMKGGLILFDIGTGLLLIQLLARLGLPRTWSVAWFWCPLVMKEIANSGHLDSIAVFFTTLAIWMLVNALWPKASEKKPSTMLTGYAFVVLAIAVAAKIYPLVLFPLFVVVALKRLGARALLPAALFPILVAVLLWPILSHLDSVKNLQQYVTGVEEDPELYVAGVEEKAALAPPPGIEAFARHWEMNDMLFMLMVENLKPYGKKPEDFDVAAGDQPSRIWFVKTSNEFRHKTAEAVADAVPTVDKHAAPFWLTRMVTLGIFGVVVLWGCMRLSRSNDPRLFLEIVFLTIAWFWLLAPTQNPWYWTWALPLICFCRNPAWYLFAVTSMAYYLRFYCEYHLADDAGKFGTPFSGTALFDFNVPILEFGPLLVLLVVLMLGRIFFSKFGSPLPVNSEKQT